MSLPEFVTPVLSIAGPPALVFVILRRFPHTARAVVVSGPRPGPRRWCLPPEQAGLESSLARSLGATWGVADSGRGVYE